LKAKLPGGVRPTSDRVREAMFDVLMSLDAIEDAHVLDGFAGSGALGIEALSRGAASVTFVDMERAAIAAVEANLECVGFGRRPGVRAVRSETLGFLATSRTRYDLALIDPPYRFSEWDILLERLRAGIAVLESPSPIAIPAHYEVFRTYRHGGTLLTVITEARAVTPAMDGTPAAEEGAT